MNTPASSSPPVPPPTGGPTGAPTDALGADPRRGTPRPSRLSGPVLLGLAAGLLIIVALLSLRVGAQPLTWQQFLHAYTHDTGTTGDTIVRSLRGPRLMVAIEVGAALSVAGALIQGLTRNPLADPGILGVNAGAAFAVVVGIGVFHAARPSQFVWFALPGALVATALTFVLTGLGRGRPTPLKLTLAGVVVAALFGALTEAGAFLSPSVADSYRFWIVGDVGGRGVAVVAATAPLVILGLLMALPLGRALNLLGLGEDLAQSLGLHLGVTRAGTVMAVCLLAGAAVAAAGPIAFVGLAVPTAVRALVGNDYRWVLPVTALAGACFVVTTDVVARVVQRPAEIETGLVVSAVGAPLFLYLVSRKTVGSL